METLRFTTAGSVDDGKSTLIGRLLLESHALHQDQLEAVRQASRKRGHQDLDLSLFTDGLRDEREQKITIDVAYRYFSTPRRKFIIADSPGHTQYTRNMVTAASSSELAVILVDARHGLTTQSKRHAFLSTLLGLPHLVIAVNKMDLVDHQQETYENLKQEFQKFAAKLEVGSLTFLPISALHGDNVVTRSPRMPWYQGSTLIHHLETVNVGATRNALDFRFPVQIVIRPHQDYRGYAGQVASGRVAVGDPVVILPSGAQTSIKAIEVYQEQRQQASVGDSVVLRLHHEQDVSRGDLIVRRNNLPTHSTNIDATLCWLASTPLQKDKHYDLRHGTRKLSAKISALQYSIDVDTMHRNNAATLQLNEIGRVRISTSEPLYFDAYRQNRQTGSFLLSDPQTHDTVAAGIIRGPSQKPPEPSQGKVVWLTGLSGAGKSTLAQQLKQRLGAGAFVIDGDRLRSGLCADLGFSAQDRAENARRAAELAKLAYEQGLTAIVALISPFAADRAKARALFPPGEFFEVHVHCPIETCRQRDPKGLYAKSDQREITEFTGVDSPYEEPLQPELFLDTSKLTPEESAALLSDRIGPQGARAAFPGPAKPA